jgi:hypothetical protein
MPTNQRAHAYYDDESVKCVYHMDTVETEDHILKCKSEGRSHLRLQWLNELEQYLSSSHTREDFKHCIIMGMKKWLGMQYKNRNHGVSNLTRKAAREQIRLGWDHFIGGRLTITWGETINEHLQGQQIKNFSAKQWGGL